MRIENDWFSAERIDQSGQCFRWERQRDGSFLIPAFDAVLHLQQISETELELDCSESDFSALWKDYFDLNFNYAAFTDSGRSDQNILHKPQFLPEGCGFFGRIYGRRRSALLSVPTTISHGSRRFCLRFAASAKDAFHRRNSCTPWNRTFCANAGLGTGTSICMELLNFFWNTIR